MTESPSLDVLERLKSAVGPLGWSQNAHELAPHLLEWRDRTRGATPILLKPDTTQRVSAIVAICHNYGIGIVPQGGNTGLAGGQIPNPRGNEVLLSLRRMNKIRACDPTSNTLIVEAGTVLSQVQAEAAAAERLFPLSLASEGSATIGGLISTNAGGTGVLAYGNMRDLVLGLEVVLPNGEIWSGLSALRKDNTGYDLKQLFIGAEGTLGVVTGAVLKLFPKPRVIETAYAAVKSPADAIALLHFARAHSSSITGFELLPASGLEFVLKHIAGTRAVFARAYPWLVLFDASLYAECETGTAMTILTDALQAGLILDGTVAQSMAQALDFWKLRDSMSQAQKGEGGSIKHDISVPLSSIAEFIERATNAVCAYLPGIRPVPFGHLGDGNIHFNFSQPIGMNTDAFLAHTGAINRIVHDLVHDAGGSISAEHGIGIFKVDELTRYKSPKSLSMMRALKSAIDPKGIMNPGKIFTQNA